MANNAVQRGNVVTLVAPTGGVVSGQALLVGAFFAIASSDAVATDEFEAQLTGVWELPKVAANTPTQGGLAYWNDTSKEVTTTVGSNKIIGAFTEARANGTTTCYVRLNGVAV